MGRGPLSITGFPEQALLVSTDLDHKFDLAVALKKLDVAYTIAKESDSDAKWKQLGELALACWNFTVCSTTLPLSTLFPQRTILRLLYVAEVHHIGLSLTVRVMVQLAEECMIQAKDYSGLLLLFSSAGNPQGLLKLAAVAREAGKNNITFVCYFLLRRLEDCLQLLCDTQVCFLYRQP